LKQKYLVELTLSPGYQRFPSSGRLWPVYSIHRTLHETHERTLETAVPNGTGNAEFSHQRVISFQDDEKQVGEFLRVGGYQNHYQRETVDEEFKDLLELGFKLMQPAGNWARRSKSAIRNIRGNSCFEGRLR
jgi:hypothetical protein